MWQKHFFKINKTRISVENCLLSLTFTLLLVLSPSSNMGGYVRGNWLPFYDGTIAVKVFQ